MKKNMTKCMNLICDGSTDSLETIITTKYRKFASFYWAIKPISDNISSMKYDDSTADDVFTVTLDFESNSKSIATLKGIISSGLSDIRHDISTENKSLIISIYMDESDRL